MFSRPEPTGQANGNPFFPLMHVSQCTNLGCLLAWLAGPLSQDLLILYLNRCQDRQAEAVHSSPILFAILYASHCLFIAL